MMKLKKKLIHNIGVASANISIFMGLSWVAVCAHYDYLAIIYLLTSD